jgi:tetratricopeptide (TPR) repeat protein
MRAIRFDHRSAPRGAAVAAATRAAALLVACIVVPASPAPAAAPERPEVDALLDELQALDKRRDDRAEELQSRIWRLWYQQEDPEARAAMERGLRALTRERYPQAVESFTRAIELDPDYAEAWNRRGTTYYLMGRYEASLDDIERVLELEPRHFGALAGRGLCLRELGRPRAAIAAFERALDVNPHMDRVYIEILRVRARLDEGSAGEGPD